MLYRRFGRTELQMPLLSFGCMRSMHSWTDAPLSSIPEDSTAALETLARTALSHGINHFETAQDYGSSERQLGAVIQKLTRSEVILQTKVKPEADPEVFLRRVDESLARLQVKYLDLLALHGINDYRSLWYSCRRCGCLAAARRLQRQGKVRHIGFSGHGPVDVIMAAVDHEEDGGFDFANIHWYYIYDVNRPAIERAADRDLGVYIISPTDKGGMLHRPAAAMAELCSPLSPMAFNDAYCLSQPGVTGIGVGAARPSDFDEHLRALDFISDQRPQLIVDIVRRLEERMESRTGQRRPDHHWHQLPPYQSTPGNINLPFISWLWNLVRGWDLEEFARARYAMLSGGDTWVPGNNAAALDLVKFDRIITRYPAFTAAFLDELRRAHHYFTKPLNAQTFSRTAR